MSPLPPLHGNAARPAGDLHTRRCVRHESREAAARCPECRRDFCRECVIDHEGRLLCTACLAKATLPSLKQKHNWAGMLRLLGLGAAILAGWVAFFVAGTLLLKVPAAVHEGTIWKAAPKAP